MNKNKYLNFIVTLLGAVSILLGFVLIRAVDTLRFRVETLVEHIKAVEYKLDNISGFLNHFSFAAVPSHAANPSKQSHKSGKMANSEFYEPNAEEGGRIITVSMADTKNMNYLINNETQVGMLWSYCNDSLAERNYEHPEKFEPQLAELWSISADKLVYTITLKKGVYWHDFTDPVTGKEWKDKEVTANDFKFYLDVVKNPKTDCAPSRVYLKDMEKIEVLSKYKFKVYWKKKYFLSESITLGLSPLPEHLYHAYKGPFDPEKFNDDHKRNRIIVGCGPYKFVKWDKGRRIILKRWERYYGRRYGVMPPLKYIIVEIIKHPNTQFQALIAGKIDRMGLRPEQWVNQTQGKAFEPTVGYLKKFKYLSRSYSYIGYNLRNPLFSDRRVRKALTHLVNRKRILREVYYGLGKITTGNFFINSPYYDKSIKPYDFSVEKAKKLLKEAGWTDTDGDGIIDKNGKKFEFTVMAISNSTTQQKMLPMIKEDMAKAGIVMNIQNIEWSVYIQRLENKQFDVCMLAWSLGFESDPYQIWHSSQADIIGSSNHISFKNRKADKLIEKIRVCFDLKKRIKLCHEFHRLLHEEQPYTFLITPYNLIAQSSRYRNVRIFPGGIETKIMWVPKKQQKKVNY